MSGVGSFLWKIAVALYLIANGVLGLQKTGDFAVIFSRIGFKGDALGLFAIIFGVIALVAGIAVLLEMLNIQLSFLDTLLFIIAIIWAVFIILFLVGWIRAGFKPLWGNLQALAVYLFVCSSLLIASKKLG